MARRGRMPNRMRDARRLRRRRNGDGKSYGSRNRDTAARNHKDNTRQRTMIDPEPWLHQKRHGTTQPIKPKPHIPASRPHFPAPIPGTRASWPRPNPVVGRVVVLAQDGAHGGCPGQGATAR
jgi:hypothetical protein